MIFSYYDGLTLLTVLLFGALVSTLSGYGFGLSYKRALFLYGWHTLFALLYVVVIHQIGGDALGYYFSSLKQDIPFRLGTDAVSLFTSVFTRGLEFSFLATSLVFNIIGTFGLLALDGLLKLAVRKQSIDLKLLASVVVLLPSISFWSAGLGKDAISFTAICLALWSLSGFKRAYWLLGASVLLMFFVRPHIAGLMIIALSATLLTSSAIGWRVKALLFLMAVGITLISVKFVFIYIGLGEVSSISDVWSYIEARQVQNLEGGSSFNLKDMGFSYKLFTYAFRPLPFDAHHIMSAASAVENVILLVLGAMALKGLYCREEPIEVSKTGFNFAWIYTLLTWSILALTTANMGIAVRQKWMFFPAMLLLIFVFIGYANTKSTKEKLVKN